MTRLPLLLLLAVALTSCTLAGETELAFCAAKDRNDAAAAKAIFDAGAIDMMARTANARCQPGRELFEAARPNAPVFTEMAVAFARRPGIASTCWAGGKGAMGGGCTVQIVAQNANATVMRALIDAGLDVTDQRARGALADAAIQGSLEIVRMMVEKGADPSAALSAAVDRREIAIIEYLESKGALEDLPPLLVAARRGDVAAVDAAIAAHADLEAVDGRGRTPLIRAAFYGHAPVVARLARAGAKLDAVTSEDQHSALLVAAAEGHVDVIQTLAAARADMNVRPAAAAHGEVWPPLMAAIANGRIAAVRALLAAGADPNTWTEGDSTAIRRAAQLGNLAMTQALLAAGARVNERHGTSWAPPVFAVLGLCGPIPEGDSDNDAYRATVLKALIAAGADTTARDASGATPLEIVTKLRAETQDPFYAACHDAKIAALTRR